MPSPPPACENVNDFGADIHEDDDCQNNDDSDEDGGGGGVDGDDDGACEDDVEEMRLCNASPV